MLGARTRSQTGCTALVVGDEVVVIGGTAAAPVATVAVSTFRVSGILQALRNDTPLHGEVLTAINRQALIDAPTDRAVVDDDIVVIHRSQAVALVFIYMAIAQAETHITDDDIVAVDGDGIVGHADTVTRSRLSKDGFVGFDAERLGQEDGSGHIEDDDALTGLLDAIAQGTFQVGVVEARDVIDAAAASACGIHPESFSARESREGLCAKR